MGDTVQTYYIISIGGYLVAGVFFLVAIFLFFFLDVAQAIGILSGHTEKKEIEAIRERNKQMKENPEVVTDMSQGKRRIQTDKMDTKKLQMEAKADMYDETSLLSSENETTLLSSDDTTLLEGAGYGQTAQLADTGLAMGDAQPVRGTFVIEEEILLIHTDEVID